MTTVDLEPRRLDPARLPLRRRVAPPDVPALVAADPALAPLRDPEVVVEVEVTAPRPDGGSGRARLRCRHGLHGDRVAATAWAGGAVEVVSLGVEHWQTELARAADVPAPRDAAPPPDDRVEAPLDVVLGAGEALRTGRTDVLEELVRRAGADDPGHLRGQLVRLHRAVSGRLLATIASREGAETRVGWVSWLMYADGWRSLLPVRVEGRPCVRLLPATPRRLGAEVAALVTHVRGRP